MSSSSAKRRQRGDFKPKLIALSVAACFSLSNGQSFANPKEIEQATRVATAQLNRRANPWIWGRPPKDHRHYRRIFCYRI